MNATDAYKRAGYSAKDDNVAKVCASKLLTKTNIKEKIQESLKEKSKRNEITADWVVAQLKKNYERCMQAIPVFDKSGNPTGWFKCYEMLRLLQEKLWLLQKKLGLLREKLGLLQ